MSFIDDSIKNVKHQLIKEVSGGSVGGFVGGRGMGIDALFAGPYHPDHNEVDKLLKKQLKDRKEKRKDIESSRDGVIDDYSGLADPVGGYYETDTEFARLAYDELEAHNQMAIDYSIENTPLNDVEWKSTGWNYDYDEPGEAYRKVLKYDDNSYNNPVIKNIKYDDNSNLYAGDDYINNSEINWKIINRG